MEWNNICSFPLFANVPAAIEFRNIKVSGWATELVQNLIILTDILSWPHTLFTSKAFIILKKSDSLKVIDWIRPYVMQVNSLGKTLLFDTNVHCFAKKELKIFAFCWKPEKNAPLNSKASITGTFLQLKKVFIIDQQVVNQPSCFLYWPTACYRII